MKREIFNELTNQGSGWLDYNDVERINIIRSEVDNPLEDEAGRAQRLRKAQPHILDIIAPCLDRIVENAADCGIGSLALNKLVGCGVGQDDQAKVFAGHEANKALQDIRSGTRIVDFDEVISGEFLLTE